MIDQTNKPQYISMGLLWVKSKKWRRPKENEFSKNKGRVLFLIGNGTRLATELLYPKYTLQK